MTTPNAREETAMPSYEQNQIDRVTADGPDPEMGSKYGLKIWGATTETKTLSITPDQLARIREVLGE